MHSEHKQAKSPAGRTWSCPRDENAMERSSLTLPSCYLPSGHTFPFWAGCLPLSGTLNVLSCEVHPLFCYSWSIVFLLFIFLGLLSYLKNVLFNNLFEIAPWEINLPRLSMSENILILPPHLIIWVYSF